MDVNNELLLSCINKLHRSVNAFTNESRKALRELENYDVPIDEVRHSLVECYNSRCTGHVNALDGNILADVVFAEYEKQNKRLSDPALMNYVSALYDSCVIGKSLYQKLVSNNIESLDDLRDIPFAELCNMKSHIQRTFGLDARIELIKVMIERNISFKDKSVDELRSMLQSYDELTA